MQFRPPDDEHMCSKHVEVRNKIIVKQKFCVSSWLITEINNISSVYTLQIYQPSQDSYTSHVTHLKQIRYCT